MTITETNKDPKANTNTVENDGGNAPVTDAKLTAFKGEAKLIVGSSNYNITERRLQADETRFTIWPGQSPDGRKHASANNDEPAFPYEGASDARVRTAEMIITERTLVLMAAALRNLPEVKSLDAANMDLGGKLTKVLQWVLQNKLGGDFVREVMKLAQFQEGGAPGGAMLGIWWEQETALEMKTITLEELQGLLVQTYGLAPADWAGIETALLNPDRDGETAEVLQQSLNHVTAKRARTMVKELRADGAAQYPCPYLRLDQPVLCAYRPFEDIFFPTNTPGVQRGRCFFLREWLYESEVRERTVSHGYSETFVTEVLKHEAATMFPNQRRNPTTGDFLVTDEEETKEAHRGQYEVVTALFRATNEDNIPGIYYFPFHTDVEEAGHERRLLEYQHGQYPFTWFGREILSNRMIDTRGVPEMVTTDQNALKLLTDSFNDNVTLSTLPNIKVPRRRSKLSLVIGPLKIIKEDRPGDVNWMQPPQYPAGNDKQQEEIRRRVDEFWGRVSTSVMPVLTQLHQLGMTTLFLASLTDALTQLLQLCQQYLSDEELAMITGDDGIPIARTREEIQGKFSMTLTFDPRDLDMGYLKEIATIIIELVSKLDRNGSVRYTGLLQRLFAAISPRLAAQTIMPEDEAQQHEVEDEQNNFAKISAGVEPMMVASGLNFPLRLQTLTNIVQSNPEAYQKLTPTSRKIFEARVKYLQNQVQQIRNAQIGRQVGQPALEGQGISAMAGAGS